MSSPELFRKLKSAAKASKSFSLACKRALENAQPVIDTSFSQSQPESQDPSQPSQIEDSDLTEQELRAWREATEPLSKLLPGHIVYFIPYSVIPPGEEDGPHRARIDAINLALILEIFLPASTREKYPDLTMRIPYIDGSDIVPSSQSFSHLSIGSQTSFGMSQASQPLTQEERVIQIVDPLAELRIVYLQLCAGRTESHVKFVIRAILLVISCVSIITATKARELSVFKPQDIVNIFDSAFLRGPTLLGAGRVFETKELQDKACRLWEKLAGDVVQRFNTSLASTKAYSWEGLGDKLLTDVFRHVMPPVMTNLEKAEATSKSKAPALPKPTASLDKIVSKDAMDVPAPATKKAGPIKVAAKAEVARLQPDTSSVLPPKKTAESIKAKANVPRPTTSVPTAPKPSDSSTSSTFIIVPAPMLSTPTPAFAPPATVEEDEFGPRIPNPAHKGQVLLPERERTTTRAFGGEEVDMMEYMQDLDDGQDFGDVNTGEDPAPEETQFEDLVARFGQAPYVEAPKQGFSRIPRDFRFNAPQQNATKVMMTPSPESQAKVPSYPARAPTGSTLSKMKSAVVTERAKARGGSAGPTGDAAPVKSKTLKRKTIEEEGEEHAEDPASTRKKKRKAVNEMPPPAAPTKGTGTNSVRSSETLVQPPHAARHSSTSETVSFNSSAMAGPSRVADRAAPKATKRYNIVLADTDSSEDEPVIRTKSKSTALVEPVNSITATKKASATALRTTTKPPVSLTVNDALMLASRMRLEQIKAINQKNKELMKELGPDSDDEDIPKKQDKDDDETEDDGDSEEEVRKFRRSATDSQQTKTFEESRQNLADLKTRAKASSKLPHRRRQNHIIPETLSEDEPEAIETDEEGDVAKSKKRGRPRHKDAKPVAPKRSASPAQKTETKRINMYKTNAQEVGKRRWTEEESRVLLFALEAEFYKEGGTILHPWAGIQKRHGPDGTECQTLANRNVVQLKDRARNMATKMANSGMGVPEYLSFIKLPKRKLRR